MGGAVGMTATPTITNFTQLYDVPTGNGVWVRENGTLLWKPFAEVGVTTLDGLSDVNTAGAVNGRVLTYNAGTWTPVATAPPALDDLTDVTTAGQSTGKVLTYNGTAWAPAVTAAGAQLDYKGDWAAGTYQDGDVVVYGGVVYICTKGPVTTPPDVFPPSGALDAIPKSLVDAAGDLIVGNANDSVQRLAPGTLGHVLTRIAAAPGVGWQAPPVTTRIFGRVSGGATILAGTGFSVVRNAAGNFSVNYAVAFAVPPAVVITQEGDMPGNAQYRVAATNVNGFQTINNQASDTSFNFIAMA
jgi:hypothetical protein